jgi:hypothetical protein
LSGRLGLAAVLAQLALWEEENFASSKALANFSSVRSSSQAPAGEAAPLLRPIPNGPAIVPGRHLLLGVTACWLRVTAHADKRCVARRAGLVVSISPGLGDAGFRICLTLSVMLAGSAVISRSSPTHLAFRVWWVLVALANFVALVLLSVVFLLGGVVRLPGARKEIAAVEREQLRSKDAGS